ncbi:PREDICTED: LOC107484759 isoform, partial [Prunus dulcis]
KNVFDTLVGTILDIEGKTKDTIKARLDLERMGIRRGLWMNRDSDKARRDLAFFSMKPNDKKEFLKFVSSVKFPDGYVSNIARCLRHDIVQVLCKFEMIFPPAFFTSMMHVMVHLPEEALLAGPVNYRWMYPIE